MIKAVGICDICGFKYKLSELQKNSYGMMVCPTDFEGKYDLKSHASPLPFQIHTKSWQELQMVSLFLRTNANDQPVSSE